MMTECPAGKEEEEEEEEEVEEEVVEEEDDEEDDEEKEADLLFGLCLFLRRCVSRADAISCTRSTMKLPSVSMYTHAPETPPMSLGMATLQASCMQICVLPMPGAPQNSVICPIGTPPEPENICLSISAENVTMPARLRADLSMVSALFPARVRSPTAVGVAAAEEEEAAGEVEKAEEDVWAGAACCGKAHALLAEEETEETEETEGAVMPRPTFALATAFKMASASCGVQPTSWASRAGCAARRSRTRV